MGGLRWVELSRGDVVGPGAAFGGFGGGAQLATFTSPTGESGSPRRQGIQRGGYRPALVVLRLRGEGPAELPTPKILVIPVVLVDHRARPPHRPPNLAYQHGTPPQPAQHPLRPGHLAEP